MGTTLIGILAMAALAAPAAQLPAPFDYPSQVGVAEVNVAAYGCLTIVNDTLQEGETITLIDPVEPQRTFQVAIRRKLVLSCSRNVDYPVGASFYSFRAGSEAMGPAVALVRFAGDIRSLNDRMRADLNGDRLPESFRSCTSSEGVHLTVWAGEPLASRRLWHQYFHLGYDMEPDCTPGDYGD
jgi:hypothetical protein